VGEASSLAMCSIHYKPMSLVSECRRFSTGLMYCSTSDLYLDVRRMRHSATPFSAALVTQLVYSEPSNRPRQVNQHGRNG